MRSRVLVLLSSLLAGCAASPQARAGLPWSLIDHDRGDLSGVWRQVSSDGRRTAAGYMLTIDLSIGTFAVQKGCTATGGALRPLGADRFRVEHYTSGFAAADCPPWRRDPALAPFHGTEVRLVRRGPRLSASAGASSTEFMRVTRG